MKEETLPAASLTRVKPPRRVSERKLKANRENAKKSTGPRTARGKAFSRRNAVKHGLCAKDLFPLLQFSTFTTSFAKNTSQWDLKKNGRSAESPFGRVVGSPQLT